MIGDTFREVVFDVLLIAAVGIGGGETLGRLMFCDWDINVPPPPIWPLPGPDECDILVGLFALGLIRLLDDIAVILDLDVSVFFGRGGTIGGIFSEASLG